MMEAKPKKKGFNLFDDDDDGDIDEVVAPFISKDPVPEVPKTTTTVTSSNNVMAGSGAAGITHKFGQQAQQQPVHKVFPSTMNTTVVANKHATTSPAGQKARSFASLPTATAASSINKTTTTRKQQAQQPANIFISSSSKTDSTGKPITSSKLGPIFGSRLTTTAKMTNSAYKNITTTSTSANQQLKHNTDVKATVDKETTTTTSNDGKVQAFKDSRAGASSSRQRPQTCRPGNAPTVAAIDVEQQLPSVKATTVTPSVGTQGCPLLSKYQPVPMRPLVRPKLTFREVLKVSTNDEEEQLQPAKALTIVQQPKATVEEAPVISEFQAVITETVEQNPETSSSVAAGPSGNLDHDLGLALMGLPHKDFAFTIESDQILIHKIVLAARSPYFYQQFYENLGSTPDFKNVDECDKEVVKLAVHACYGQYFDETTLAEHIAKQLIIFADIYGMKCVKNLLPQTMAKFITEETICAAAARSYDNDDYELRRKCADFVAGLILQHKPIPLGMEELPIEFNKEIILAIAAKNKKQ